MNDPYSPPSASAASQPSALSSEDRTWALAAHLSALTAYFTGVGMVVGPLVVWLINKDSRPYAAAEAKEALNFNISWLLWGILWGIASFILTFVFIGILMFFALGLFYIIWTVLCIIAAVKANEGKPYRYPLTVRFIS
ncbi:DUF4870 domain-containing protein [Luteolibacter flavescens]|uniref:DUF4870 domain-containing protein n=1 Tax=Luteolibacter flavescens TaxID=1859460 RepID=A0ABT3FI63_9BACT|nr:DUF4870 domain-containing protein [Luteolibacter flavescens]MCW1883242.1 DUF4870 domain-containing protein [Luteolibacter flavescens]